MLKKARAFFALIAFLTTVKCDISIYTKDQQQIDIKFKDALSLFGSEIPMDGIKGYIVNADPEEGCKALKPPPSKTGSFFALIKRGKCNFDVKVRNAQNSNYTLAIVYNVNSSNILPMDGKNISGINIPSVFVGDNTGRGLKDYYLYSNGFFVIIDNEFPFDINLNLLLPFAVIVAVCFFAMLGFMLIKWIKDRRRAFRHRLPTSTLRKIPISAFVKGDPYDTCAICLDDYMEGDKLRILPCAHAYHCKCIDPWLTRNRRFCPICKRRVCGHNEDLHAVAYSSDTDSDEPNDRTPLVPPHINNSNSLGVGTFRSFRGRVFTRGRSANTVPVHPPVMSSINAASADYDTASSHTDSSDSMSSDYQHMFDQLANQAQPISADSLPQETMSNTEPIGTNVQNHIV